MFNWHYLKSHKMKSVEEVRQDSEKAALRDLEANKFGKRAFGLIRNQEMYKKAFAEWGINVQIIGGDNIDSLIEADGEGYNNIMIPEIKKRFGENIFEVIRERYEQLRREDCQVSY